MKLEKLHDIYFNNDPLQSNYYFKIYARRAIINCYFPHYLITVKALTF